MLFESLTSSLIAFFVAAAVILVVGSKLTRVADELADRTGLGEALAGAVLLGATTSLPGIVVSVSAAWEGRAELATANAIGGIAVQTFFLTVADAFHKESNLEHAAASQENMLQAALLVTLLVIPLIAASVPQMDVFGVHPVSLLMLGIYWYGASVLKEMREEPMWHPRATRETREDVPGEPSRDSTAKLWAKFAVFGFTLGVSGWIVMQAATGIARAARLSDSVAGEVFTAITTSLPELVTSVAAARRGALALAVGGIIGGNAFDTLFLAFADFAYRPGSLYGAMTTRQIFSIEITILMTTILLGGLIRRQKHGVINIGYESFTIAVLYALFIATGFFVEF